MNNNNKASAQKPVAILVLYEPGYRFKLKKYYLKAGKNYIGSHHAAHIPIKECPQYAAIITITSDMVYIEALAPEAVYVPSNLVKDKKLMVELELQIRYAIPMEKDFIICRNKALMQILSHSELLQVKNVENQLRFCNSLDINDDISQHTQKLPQNCFDGTLLIDENLGYEATIPIDDNNIYGSTLLLDNNHDEPTLLLQGGSYDPTIQLDQQLHEPTVSFNNTFNAQSYRQSIQSTLPQGDENIQAIYDPRNLMKSQSRRVITSSQFAAMNSSLPYSLLSGGIKNTQQQFINRPSKKQSSQNNNEGHDGSAEISMVSTIRDQMPQTIQEQQMGATLQQQDESEFSKKKLYQSMPIRKNNYEKDDNSSHRFHSLQNEKHQQKQIQDFEDLFGSAQNMGIDFKKQKQKKEQKLNDSFVTQKLSDNLSHKQQGLQKDVRKQDIDSIKNLNKTNNQQKQKQKKLIKVGTICCRREDLKTKQLKEKGYQIVDHPDEEFQILLVGNNGLKLSKRLMMALIEGKQIQSIHFLTDPKAKITGKLEGFLWEHIEKRKGKQKSIFTGKYYLQQGLKQDFFEVMQRGGAEMIAQLKKNHSKTNICLIIDEKTQQGKNLYLEKKNYKKWKFFKKRMVIESVLMGEQIKQKHQIDQYQI